MVRCDDCGKPGTVWEIDSCDGILPDTFNFCDEHAGKFGFCLGCGYFCGGTTDYEFGAGAKYHYCGECWEALEQELINDRFDDEHPRHD